LAVRLHIQYKAKPRKTGSGSGDEESALLDKRSRASTLTPASRASARSVLQYMVVVVVMMLI
jgi:hypothetical protein